MIIVVFEDYFVVWYGGEEFVMVFSNIDVKRVFGVVEIFCKVVEFVVIVYEGWSDVKFVILLIGVVSKVVNEVFDLDSLFKIVDDVFYKVKK